MARKEEAERLLREGLSPSQIASRMGITISSVIQYLSTRLGEGALRASDLYFAFPSYQRAALQRAIDAEERWLGYEVLRENGISREELALFETLRSRKTFAGDLYEHLSEIEIRMHGLVRTTLEAKYGSEESGWWRSGIPEPIRTRCAVRREADEEPCTERYAYTTLIDLSAIITANWECFRPLLPEPYASNRKQLESDFRRLNNIRNVVMHPVRQRKWTEDDFEFVKGLRNALSLE